jgi:hypothetical protein
MKGRADRAHAQQPHINSDPPAQTISSTVSLGRLNFILNNVARLNKFSPLGRREHNTTVPAPNPPYNYQSELRAIWIELLKNTPSPVLDLRIGGHA